MKSDDVKREDDTEIILDTALRVETIEGVHLYLVKWDPYNYMLKYYNNHKRKVSGKLHLYRGDMMSTYCLNPEIDWDQRYFDKIRGVLDSGVFASYSFKPTDEENPSDLDYTLKITDRIQMPGSKKQMSSEVTILRVGVKLQPQFSSAETMFTSLMEMNNRKKKRIDGLQETVTNLENQRSEVMVQLEKITQLKRKTEQDLLNKFAILLNKKKLKIREMQQMREIPQSQAFFQELIQQQMSTAKEEAAKSSQMIDEAQIPASQFGMSQPPMLSSLFEPQPQQRRKKQVEPDFKQPPSKEEMIASKKEQTKLENDDLFIDADEQKILQKKKKLK